MVQSLLTPTIVRSLCAQQLDSGFSHPTVWEQIMVAVGKPQLHKRETIQIIQNYIWGLLQEGEVWGSRGHL